MIFAIDFDGTIVKSKYPGIGDPVPGALETMNELIDAGHDIILFTVRSGKELREAVKYLQDNEIELYGINENPDQKSWSDSPKVFANVYLMTLQSVALLSIQVMKLL